MTVRFHAGAGPWRGKVVGYGGFELNTAGIARCAVGPELHQAISDMTTKAFGYALSIAPNDNGEYEHGMRGKVDIIPDFPDRLVPNEPMARWGGAVYNVAADAVIVEVGASNTRPYRVLRRTLEWLELVADD